MSTIIKKRHVLIFNIAGEDRKKTIFIYCCLPEHIIDVRRLVSGGSEVTVTLPGKDPVTLKVTESEEEIREAMATCKELDELD